MLAWFRCRLSGPKIQIAFLGEIKRTIPRSRPASGRAPRAGLVQDAACGTGAQRRLVLDETKHGASLSRVEPQIPSKAAIPKSRASREQMRSPLAVSTSQPTDPVATIT